MISRRMTKAQREFTALGEDVAWASGKPMLIVVVARTRLDRYDELCHQFHDWRDVRVVLDRRAGERRTPQPTFAGVNQRHGSDAGWMSGVTPS